MIYVGTSGYYFNDWKGPFYPPGLDKGGMLAFYSQQFRAVELNFTYYAIPARPTIARMTDVVAPNFRFFVKANEATTHRRDRSVAGPFLSALEPCRAAGKLAGILAQFPYSFHNAEESRRYLAELREDFAGEKMVVEFRHRSWMRPAVWDLLHRLEFGFCCVDEPQLPGLVPPIARATSEVAYIRFHSRDASKWFAGDAQERYNYRYTPEELREWMPKVQQLAADAQVQNLYVFFNNCHAGHAAVNALEFQEMLKELGLL